MRKVVFLLIASLAIAFTACNKEKINKVNPDDISVNLNKAELQQRIEVLNYPLTFNSFKSSADVTPAPELWAIARILPATVSITVYHWENWDGSVTRNTATNNAPVVDTISFAASSPASTTYADQTLSITGAGVSNGYAYFTSHIRGEVFGGEIFAVDYFNNDGIDNQTAIAAEYSIFDNEADYNDLTIDDADATPRLWIAGDNNARGAIVRNPTLAVLEGLSADADQNLPDGVSFTMEKYNMPLLGPSGNSIIIPEAHSGTTTSEENQVWVVAGGTSYGGLVVMNKNDDSQLFTRVDVANAKHFDMGETLYPGTSGSYGAFLYGTGVNTAKLRMFDTSLGPFQNFTTYDLAADVTFEGKNAVDVDDFDGLAGGDVFVYCAMGDDGVYKVNATTGATTFFNDLDTFGGTGLANGLVVSGDYVYVAWGASGLVILDKATLAVVGQYNGIGSCNYVAIDTDPTTNDDILFAGFGTGGIVMLKFVDDVNP